MEEVLSLDKLPLEVLEILAKYLKPTDFVSLASTHKSLWNSDSIRKLYSQKWREFKFEKLTQPSRQLSHLEYLTFLLLSEIEPIHFRVTDDFREICQAVIDQLSKWETPFTQDNRGWIWELVHAHRKKIDDEHRDGERICGECLARDTDLGIAVTNCTESGMYDLEHLISMVAILMPEYRGEKISIKKNDVAVEIGDSDPSGIAQIEADFNVRWWCRFLRNLFSVSGGVLIIGCHRVITNPEAVADTHLSAFLKGGIFLLMLALVCEMQQRYDLRSSITHTLFGSSSSPAILPDDVEAAPASPGTKKTQ